MGIPELARTISHCLWRSSLERLYGRDITRAIDVFTDGLITIEVFIPVLGFVVLFASLYERGRFIYKHGCLRKTVEFDSGSINDRLKGTSRLAEGLRHTIELLRFDALLEALTHHRQHFTRLRNQADNGELRTLGNIRLSGGLVSRLLCLDIDGRRHPEPTPPKNQALSIAVGQPITDRQDNVPRQF